MYKTILIPIALDHEDHRGVRSIAIAQKLVDGGGKIVLLHVLEAIPSYVSSYLPDGTLEHNRKAALDELTEIAAKAGGNCSAEVLSGHASQSILDFADSHAADCIVISSHEPGLQDYFLGSTAARVVRHAKCCVHVIR